MAIIRLLCVAMGLGTSAVQSAATPPRSSMSLRPREDIWAETMKDMNFPDNKEVCDMYASGDENAWDDSKATLYFTYWFMDNGPDDLSDWPQRMHINATKEGTPSELDCTTLHSEFCNPPADGDCDNYNPAAFALIQTQIVNLYSILQSLDIAAIKNTLLESLNIGSMISDLVPADGVIEEKKKISTAAVSMWIMSGVSAVIGLAGPAGWAFGSTALIGGLTRLGAASAMGGFGFNTLGAGLSIWSTNKPDGEIDIDELEAQLEKYLATFFQQTSDRTAALTAKLFGGEPSQDVDLMEFVRGIDDWYDNKWQSNEFTPLLYLFQNGWFLDPSDSSSVVQPMFEAGFKVMRVGFVAVIMKAMNAFVVRWDKLSEDLCNSEYSDIGMWIDDKCYTLLRRLDADPILSGEAPNDFLKKSEEKYNLNREGFFRNVIDCDNNMDLIGKADFGVDAIETGDRTLSEECFFGLNILTVDSNTRWDTARPKDIVRDVFQFDLPANPDLPGPNPALPPGSPV